MKNGLLIFSLLFIISSSISCQVDQERKGTNITKNDSTKTQHKTDFNSDKILGLWQVTNKYYQAVYEFEKYNDSYLCKIHFYDDGKLKYKLQNKESDYFITDMVYKNKIYKGKLYLKDGIIGKVIIIFIDSNTIQVSMKSTVKEYKEIWNRKTSKE